MEMEFNRFTVTPKVRLIKVREYPARKYKDIVSLYKQVSSFAELGKLLGVSRQRAHAIYLRELKDTVQKQF